MVNVAFREENSRTRAGHAPEDLALLRHTALNLLRQEGVSKVGVKAKCLKAFWSENYLPKVLISGHAIAMWYSRPFCC